MTDAVHDGFGPILQRIQERLSNIEDKLTNHDRRFDSIDVRLQGIEKELSGVTLRLRYALGAAQDVEFTTNERADALERQLAALTARVRALEPADA
jgi:septal ring factor EnvC (AmiA/AmiB activator)